MPCTPRPYTSSGQVQEICKLTLTRTKLSEPAQHVFHTPYGFALPRCLLCVEGLQDIIAHICGGRLSCPYPGNPRFLMVIAHLHDGDGVQNLHTSVVPVTRLPSQWEASDSNRPP